MKYVLYIGIHDSTKTQISNYKMPLRQEYDRIYYKCEPKRSNDKWWIIFLTTWFYSELRVSQRLVLCVVLQIIVYLFIYFLQSDVFFILQSLSVCCLRHLCTALVYSNFSTIKLQLQSYGMKYVLYNGIHYSTNTQISN